MPSSRIPPLPRRARRFADRLVFVERLESRGAAREAEDRDFVARYQAGDREVMHEIYLRYFEQVYGYVRFAVRDYEEAEDVTQQVFEELLRSLVRFDPDRGSLSGWVFGIARNSALKANRRYARRSAESSESAEAVAQAAGMLGEHRVDDVEGLLPTLSDADLRIFIRRLPPAQREVMVLRYVLDLSMSQIAAVTERSVDAVKKLHQRGLRTLHERMVSVGQRPERRRGSRRSPMRTRYKPARVIVNRRFALGLPQRPVGALRAYSSLRGGRRS